MEEFDGASYGVRIEIIVEQEPNEVEEPLVSVMGEAGLPQEALHPLQDQNFTNNSESRASIGQPETIMSVSARSATEVEADEEFATNNEVADDISKCNASFSTSRNSTNRSVCETKGRSKRASSRGRSRSREWLSRSTSSTRTPKCPSISTPSRSKSKTKSSRSKQSKSLKHSCSGKRPTRLSSRRLSSARSCNPTSASKKLRRKSGACSPKPSGKSTERSRSRGMKKGSCSKPRRSVKTAKPQITISKRQRKGRVSKPSTAKRISRRKASASKGSCRASGSMRDGGSNDATANRGRKRKAAGKNSYIASRGTKKLKQSCKPTIRKRRSASKGLCRPKSGLRRAGKIKNRKNPSKTSCSPRPAGRRSKSPLLKSSKKAKCDGLPTGNFASVNGSGGVSEVDENTTGARVLSLRSKNSKRRVLESRKVKTKIGAKGVEKQLPKRKTRTIPSFIYFYTQLLKIRRKAGGSMPFPKTIQEASCAWRKMSLEDKSKYKGHPAKSR